MRCSGGFSELYVTIVVSLFGWVYWSGSDFCPSHFDALMNFYCRMYISLL